MNEQELNELSRHLQRYAKEHGVEAHVVIEDTPGSDVNPPGPRLHLRVWRFIEGQAPREHPRKIGGYPPDGPDMRARLEREIRAAAEALYQA